MYMYKTHPQAPRYLMSPVFSVHTIESLKGLGARLGYYSSTSLNSNKLKHTIMYLLASSPGPSHVFNVACRKGRGPGMRSHVHGVITRHTTRAKRSLREAARFQLQNLKGRFVSTL
jgi:hypothetical protein